jgi:hypothetical protein
LLKRREEKKVAEYRIMRFISFIEMLWPKEEEEDRGNCVNEFHVVVLHKLATVIHRHATRSSHKNS